MWSLRWWTWTKCYVYVDWRSDRSNEQFCCEDSCSNKSSPLLVIVINYCCLLCVVVRIFVSCGPIHVGKCQSFIVKLKNHVWHWMSVFIELLLLGLNSLSLSFRNWIQIHFQKRCQAHDFLQSVFSASLLSFPPPPHNHLRFPDSVMTMWRRLNNRVLKHHVYIIRLYCVYIRCNCRLFF